MRKRSFTKKLQMLALVLVLALMCCTAVRADAQAARYVIELSDGAVLLDAQGQPVIERGTYGMMYALDGLPEGVVRYAAEPAAGGMSAGYALLDENAQPLTEHKYMMLEYVNGGIMFMLGERVGIMDINGNVRIDAGYTYMTACGDGSFLALRTSPYDDSADMVYHVSADGSEKSTGTKVSMLSSFDEQGLCAAMSADSFKYGYLNAQGEWAVKPRFEWAGEFKGGQAQANAVSGAGVIAPSGEWLIEPKYDLLTREGDSLIVAHNSDTLSLIDPESLRSVGSFSKKNAYAVGISSGRAAVMQGDVLTVIDRSGSELFSMNGCTGFNLWNGMENEMIVMLGSLGNDRAYLFGMDGTLLAGAYRDIMPLGMGSGGMHYLAVTYEATQVEYENGMSFWDEIPGTRRCSVIAPDGSVLCEAEAEYISWCSEDRILIHRESGWTFADLNGNTIAEFEDPNAVIDEEESVQTAAEMGE